MTLAVCKAKINQLSTPQELQGVRLSIMFVFFSIQVVVRQWTMI